MRDLRLRVFTFSLEPSSPIPMNTFYLHDGSNEQGPFTIEELKKQKLTRSTPLRITNTDSWLPAEKVDGLRPLLVPKKIKRVKDVVPVVRDTVADLHQRKPVILYTALSLVALLTALSIYSIKLKTSIGATPVAKTEVVAAVKTPVHSVLPVEPQPVITPSQIVAETKTAPKESASEAAAKAARQRWRKLITITNSNYGIGLLGGIKDLSVLVNNRTDFMLDEVEAKVTYIKASGDVWKTKLVKLSAVPAQDSKEISLPDVSRGKKVKVSLHKLVSNAMGLHYSDGEKVVEGEPSGK